MPITSHTPITWNGLPTDETYVSDTGTEPEPPPKCPHQCHHWVKYEEKSKPNLFDIDGLVYECSPAI